MSPQQPDHYGPRTSFGKSNLLRNPHPKPFHLGACPGKRESLQDENVFHRIWQMDTGSHGKWNRIEKGKFYTNQDRALFSSKPHDEIFAVRSNRKVWVHLLLGGAKAGGQEKLVTEPPRRTGLHLKHGLYKGRFENVKHQQLITVGKKEKSESGVDLAIDRRPPFDTNLKDDMVQRNRNEDQWLTEAACDLFRTANTASCPEMGYHWCYRD